MRPSQIGFLDLLVALDALGRVLDDHVALGQHADPVGEAEHDMHVVFSLADRISVLAQGHVIVEDAPERIKGNEKVQEAYLGGAHL